MNNLNNPLKLSDIIDRCLLRMAQSVNSFLDADNAMRSRLMSVIGFVITLYTLHNVEVRLRLLSVYARPLYTIAALSVLFFVAYMLLFRFAGASQINGWTSLKRTFTTQNLLFLIVCFIFAFVIYNQLFKSRKHISKPTTSFDTINLSNSTTTLNQSAIINKTIEQNAVGFNSTVFMSMISAIYHRLQKQSSCKPVEFLDIVSNYARCKNDDQDLSITSRIEAEKLFGYLSSFRSTIDEEKKIVVKNDSSESILTNLLNNLSKSSEWAQEQQREKLNQLNSHPTASISFPNLLDFWKFMIKIFLTTVILLIVTYLIIRVLLWLIENVLRPNGNGEKDKHGGENTSMLMMTPRKKLEADEVEFKNKSSDLYTAPKIQDVSKLKNESSTNIKKPQAIKHRKSVAQSSQTSTPKQQVVAMKPNIKVTTDPPIIVDFRPINKEENSTKIKEARNYLETNEITVKDLLVWIKNPSSSGGKLPSIDKIIHFDVDYVQIMNKLCSDNYENLLIKIGSKYDDLVFKHVDSALPRILDIRTVSSDNESLTLKSSVEFANVDFKVDIRKMQRVIDVRLLNATANVLMVLSQNKTNNLLFNIDCYFDPNSDVSLSFRRDANIDSGLYQYLESLIRVSVKHYMLSMEVNFISRKLTSNFRSMHPTAHQTLSSIINQSSVSTSSMIGVPSASNTGNTTTQQQQHQQQQQHSPHYNPRVAASGQQNNTDQMRGLSDQQQQMRNNINEKRLLVKVLKANNLTNIEEPFCVVELDYPMQKHITDVHRDISNINEQFLFDISASSEELTFSLFDRAKDYGNDLIGEAVLPVNDLCSSMSSKRVIQLHRYGQTKTGSITAEFLFIEPTTNRYDMSNKVNINRSSTNSRNSRSPYDPQFAQPGSNQYRDELGYDQKLNVITSDSLSSNSYLTPTMQNNYQQSPRGNQARGQDGYSPNSTLTDSYYNNNSNVQQQQQQSSNIHIIPTSDAATRAALQQQQQQQQQQQAQLPNSSVNMQQPGGANSRVINRNYLQIQPNTSGANNYATINKSGALMGQQQQQQQATASMYAVNSQLDPKHKQTISSSLKSLLMPRSTSRQHQQAAKKRDKSYDSPSLLMQSSGAAHYPYDTQSVNVDNNLRSSRTKGLTLRKLFGSKKAAQARQRYDTFSSGNVMQPLRPGSPAISVAISRPISPTQQLMMQNEQQQLYKQHQQQQQQQQKQQYLQQQQQQQQFQQGYQNYPHQQLNIAPNFSNQPQQQQQHDYVMAMSSSTVNTTNKMMANEVDSYRKQEPLLLKRGYVAP